MAQRPTIKLIDNPIAVGGAQHPSATDGQTSPAIEPERTTTQSRKAPRKTPNPAPASHQPAGGAAKAVGTATNPFAGMRKFQAPVRLFPPLWDQLDNMVRQLRAEGLEVDKTALINAVLHYYGPKTEDEGRELVNNWRALLALPPATRR